MKDCKQQNSSCDPILKDLKANNRINTPTKMERNSKTTKTNPTRHKFTRNQTHQKLFIKPNYLKKKKT